MKLSTGEAPVTDLSASLGLFERLISSELTEVEVVRAVLRTSGPDGLAAANEAIARIDLLPISRSVIERARRLEPPMLRSLDAIHLATALEPRIPPVVIAYDRRLLDSASGEGLTVESPGR